MKANNIWQTLESPQKPYKNPCSYVIALHCAPQCFVKSQSITTDFPNNISVSYLILVNGRGIVFMDTYTQSNSLYVDGFVSHRCTMIVV